jgi:calcineurin-like phosphoesterase
MRAELDLDLVIANGENLAAGAGLTPSLAEELFANGVDVITSGNHIWDKREIYDYLDSGRPVLRPLNYPDDAPGRGWLSTPARWRPRWRSSTPWAASS